MCIGKSIILVWLVTNHVTAFTLTRRSLKRFAAEAESALSYITTTTRPSYKCCGIPYHTIPALEKTLTPSKPW